MWMTHVRYGERTIAQIHNKLGWTYTTARYCQANTHEKKQFDCCTEHIDEKETFNDVTFTDESTFQLEGHHRKCFRKKTPNQAQVPAQAPSESACVGWHFQGRCHTHAFSGIMNVTSMVIPYSRKFSWEKIFPNFANNNRLCHVNIWPRALTIAEEVKSTPFKVT